MKIDFIDILNFRKLKNCRIEFADKETIFVGANNSGKTSAMDALITFFKYRNLTTRDFTLSNWTAINKLCTAWESEEDFSKLDLTIGPWEEYLPTLDVWLKVAPNEIHHVSHLIPSLDWTGGSLGVRLRYEPKELSNLCKEFCGQLSNNKLISPASKDKGDNFKLWPKTMWDYLDKDRLLASHFTIKTYLLDDTKKGTAQKLPSNAIPLEESAFNGLIKVDIINAQRGFSDVNSEEGETSKVRNLSSQLRSYYDKHLNPSLKPTANDLDALKAIESAKAVFDKNLQESFKTSLGELEDLNYPGFGSPSISLSSRFNAADTLNHETSVLYKLEENSLDLNLPEKYNGLGYQNLISMIFKLIRFRDEWMQVGKRAVTPTTEGEETEYEPLHLVLIEEPEAHLHAQVQQVFIKEAYKVLRKHKNLANDTFNTQLVISTHSNHIAHEIDFISLRYFKREKHVKGEIPTATVVNLSKTFGTDDDTTRFATRYLKTTHCDLFFADAVILVEGPAEKMLVPYFIKNHSTLKSCYISILEIGGSHAHTLRPLIENLGIVTLIITDIDACDPKKKNSKAQTQKGKGYVTGNDTIKKWLPKEDKLDTLLDFKEDKKEHSELPIKIAYQTPVDIQKVTVSPYTFEDCIVLENIEIFKAIKNSTGLLKKMVDAANEKNIATAAENMYHAITEKGAKKAEFALELLYLQEPTVLKTPTYIQEGLKWLEKKLLTNKKGFVIPKATANAS